MTLLDLRRDYRPQIVLAIGSRLIGYVPEARASLTLSSTSGAPALRVTAQPEGTDGNSIRVSVRENDANTAQDLFQIFIQGNLYNTYSFADADTAGLAAQLNQAGSPVSAAALAGGPLQPIGPTNLRGGRNENPGQLWYRLNLPIRPFGQTGWIPADAADVRTTTKRIVVDRSAKVLRVFQGTRRIYQTRVAVGRPDRKTPLGSFYVAAKYVPPANAMVSTYALELSAPAGLPDFLRGGVVGIHGTPATSSIGREASNGCVRVTPGAARALRGMIPLGTPVYVVR